MAHIKIKGEQLNIADVASDLADDPQAIASIASGITSDPTAVATLDADYLRRDGGGSPTLGMLTDLDIGGFDIVNLNLIDGRSVLIDGTNLDIHIADVVNPHGTTISNLSDVSIAGSPTLTSGDSLIYNGTTWVNQAVSTTGALWGQITGTLSNQTDLQTELNLKATVADLIMHTGMITGNPHAVTKTDLGLSQVDDTSDDNKPISTLTQAALATKFDGTFDVLVDPLIGLRTTNLDNLINYAYGITSQPNATAATITLGAPGDAMYIPSVLQSALLMKNNISLAAYENTHTSFANLVSRTGVDANVPPTNGPTNYNNEIIVGDGGVTTAIRSGTVGTNDPVIRAGSFGATDDWKIWHEGNLDTSLFATTAQLQIHTATKNAHSTAIVDLVDVSLIGSPAPINGQILSWDDTLLQWINTTPSTGVTDHILLSNIGSNTHAQIDSHILDDFIHFSTIDGLADVDTTTDVPNINDLLTYNGSTWVPVLFSHDNLDSGQNGGVGSHAAISAHMATSSIHAENIGELADVVITAASNGQVLTYDLANTRWINADTAITGVTDHTALTNIGVNTHDQIDTHIADATVHFTEASIDHVNILNKGTNTHAQIDAHIVDVANPHATAIANLTDVSFTGSPGLAVGEFLSWDGTNWSNASVNTTDGIWGSISGTLSDQTDLQTALDTKFDGTNNITFSEDTKFITPLGEELFRYFITTLTGPNPTGMQIRIGDLNVGEIEFLSITGAITVKNNNSIRSREDGNLAGTEVNLVSRTDITANIPPTQGPVNYNNEVIVGDSGVTTAIRAGTVGTNDPVIRAGSFGATDDWKIWHEGNFNPTTHFTDTANPHATTIANLADTNGVPATSDQVLTWNTLSGGFWEPRDFPSTLTPFREKQIIVGNSTTVIDTTLPTTAITAGRAALQVFRNGVLQDEGVGGSPFIEDFDVTGPNQITFSTALLDGDRVVIYSFE